MSASEAWAAEPAGGGPWRPDRAELSSAACALGLGLTMFAFKWFGVAGMARRTERSAASPTSQTGWDVLTSLRWLILATIAVTLGSLLLRLSQRRHGTRTNTGALVTLLGTATAVLVGYRVLIQLPRPAEIVDQKLGAVLGVFCAIGIALGGFGSMGAERARTLRRRARIEKAARVPPAR
jgi:hypothetical protein